MHDFYLYAVQISTSGLTDVGIGSNLSISCQATARNRDRIYFVRDGLILESNSRYNIYTHYIGYSTLRVYGVEQVEGGLYGCIMNSGVDGGTAAVEFNVTVREGESGMTAICQCVHELARKEP